MQVSSLIAFIKKTSRGGEFDTGGENQVLRHWIVHWCTFRGSPGSITVVGASPERVTHTCSMTLVHVGAVYMVQPNVLQPLQKK